MEIILVLALFVGVIVWAIGSNNADKKVTIKKEYYPNGRLKTEIPYKKDGKINGIAKAYYENGRLKIETPYKDGKANGIAKANYESGTIQKETTFVDD